LECPQGVCGCGYVAGVPKLPKWRINNEVVHQSAKMGMPAQAHYAPQELFLACGAYSFLLLFNYSEWSKTLTSERQPNRQPSPIVRLLVRCCTP